MCLWKQGIEHVDEMCEADAVLYDSHDRHFQDENSCNAPRDNKTVDWYKALKPGTFGAFCPNALWMQTKSHTTIIFEFARKLFPNTFTCYPKSFIWPEDEFDIKEYMKETKDFVIAKPSSGTMGAGIVIIQKIEDLEKLTRDQEIIIQKYINNPLLLGERNRKVDFRVSFAHIFNGKDHDDGCVYYQTFDQARICVDTYLPISEENKDNCESHITFYPALFEDPTKYKITEDLNNYDEYCNFQHLNAVHKLFDQNGKPENKKYLQDSHEDMIYQIHATHSPFSKLNWEQKSRPIVEEKGIVFCSYYGVDNVVSDDFKSNLVEVNITPSNGDYVYSQGLQDQEKINPIFIQNAVDFLPLWFEQGKNVAKGTPMDEKKWISSFKRLLKKGESSPYQKEIEVLNKLVNVFFLCTTGCSDYPKYDPAIYESTYEKSWLPDDISCQEMIKGLTSLNSRVTSAEITTLYERFSRFEFGIYLLAGIMSKLFSTEELHDLLIKC